MGIIFQDPEAGPDAIQKLKRAAGFALPEHIAGFAKAWAKESTGHQNRSAETHQQKVRIHIQLSLLLPNYYFIDHGILEIGGVPAEWLVVR